MSAKTITLEIADDGTLTIPFDLVRSLRLLPRQTIKVQAQETPLCLCDHFGLAQSRLAKRGWTGLAIFFALR